MTVRAPHRAPTWVELDLEIPPEEEDRAVAALWACGSVGSWTIRPGLVRGYFGVGAGDVERSFREAWRETTGERWTGALHPRRAPDRDWLASWRAAAVPIPVTPTLTVEPPGARPGDPGAGRGGRTVVIRPGQGFGTGSHPTTRSLLRWLETDPGARVLDVGCGSGVLGIAALLLGAGFAIGVDVDADAIANADENRRLNGLAARLHLVEGTLDAVARGARFDRVLANLDGRALVGLAGELVERCAPGGRLGVAGLLFPEREPFLDSLVGLPVELADERADEDEGPGDVWWSAWIARREDA
ncbi:MAG TPA: 50S ribosomal protein L11 methyltransferase [Gemmatimonadota bacterium]|nr:50S ribosomal protein L11 methyltransferase [Gemmatimonadota bacterium]